MDALEFQPQAPADPQLRAFLQEGAAAAGSQVPGETLPSFAVTGVDFLFLLAAYVLFRGIKEGLDGWRNRREAEEASRRAEIIEELCKGGPRRRRPRRPSSPCCKAWTSGATTIRRSRERSPWWTPGSEPGPPGPRGGIPRPEGGPPLKYQPHKEL